MLAGENLSRPHALTDNRKFRTDVMQTGQGRRADFNSVMLSPASVVAPLLVGLPLLLLPGCFSWCAVASSPCGNSRRAGGAQALDDLTPVRMDELVAELQPVVTEVNGHSLHKLDDLLRRERNFLADAVVKMILRAW